MARVVVNQVFEFDNCRGCPDLERGNSFGNDGRDGSTVYICGKGCFGSKGSVYTHYDDGPYTIPEKPPIQCPHVKSEEVDKVAKRLNVSYETLVRVLMEQGCTIVKKGRYQ